MNLMRWASDSIALRTNGWSERSLKVARGFPYPRATLLAIFLLGLLLRCFHVESQELQYDEGATGYFSALPWSDLWGGPALLEPNPPLFYSLAWLVTRAGGSVEDIRYISVVAGVLCIPLAWLIARRLAGDFAAGSAALLIATSPQSIVISQYARAYALLILCLMCAFLCLVRARHLAVAQAPTGAARGLWWWSGYAIAAVASLYTHHIAIVVLGALNISVLLGLVGAGYARRYFLKGLLVANLLVAALYAPWLPVLAVQAHPATTISSAKLIQVDTLQRLWNTVSNPFRFGGLPWVDIRLLPIILFGAWHFRLSRDVTFMIAFVLCGTALMLLASHVHPLIDGKTLAWAGLFAVVATAIGCSAAGRLRLPLLILVVLLQLRSDIAALQPAPEGWREVARVFREAALPQDTLYINYAAAVLPLRHYGWPESELNITVFAKGNAEPWFRGHTRPIIAPQAVAGEALQLNRVWLLSYGETPPTDGIASDIGTRSIRVLHRRTEKLDLSLFSVTSAEPQRPR